MMTKTHYEAIASILDSRDADLSLVQDFADYFKGENPNFDPDRFIKACGDPEPGAPRNDKDGVEQTYDAIVAAGYDVGVQDGAGEEFYGLDRDRAVSEVMSCDEGWFYVMPKGAKGARNRIGWVYFVFGNAPEEVINDYTTNIEHIIDPLSKRWGW